MKKIYDRFCIYVRKLVANVFGGLGAGLGFGGLLFTCLGNLPVGLTLLGFSALSFTFSVGKIYLDNHTASQDEKYFGDEDYEVEDYQPENELVVENEKVEETSKTYNKNTKNETLEK